MSDPVACHKLWPHLPHPNRAVVLDDSEPVPECPGVPNLAEPARFEPDWAEYARVEVRYPSGVTYTVEMNSAPDCQIEGHLLFERASFDLPVEADARRTTAPGEQRADIALKGVVASAVRETLAEPAARDLGELIAEEAATNPEFAAGVAATERELAAQQPLSRDDDPSVVAALRRVARYLNQPMINRLRRCADHDTTADGSWAEAIIYTPEAIQLVELIGAVDALPDPAARDARVRADERRRAFDEALDLIAQHAVGVSARDPFLADTLDSERLTFGQVRAALTVGWERPAAPAERVQDAPTGSTAPPERDDVRRLRTAMAEELDALRAEHPEPRVVIQGNPCCGGDGDEASCEECR